MSERSGASVDAEPRRHTLVPDPKGLPLLGSMPRFGKDPLAFFERLIGYGPMVSWRFGRNRCVFISDPDCVGELLTETERSFDQPALGIAFRTDVLARRFELDVDPGTVNPVPTLTLRPDREVMATVRVR